MGALACPCCYYHPCHALSNKSEFAVQGAATPIAAAADGQENSATGQLNGEAVHAVQAAIKLGTGERDGSDDDAQPFEAAPVSRTPLTAHRRRCT